MLTLLYLIGLVAALKYGYYSYGEELCETFPFVTRQQKITILLFSIICCFTSWIGVLYYKHRHNIYNK